MCWQDLKCRWFLRCSYRSDHCIKYIVPRDIFASEPIQDFLHFLSSGGPNTLQHGNAFTKPLSLFFLKVMGFSPASAEKQTSGWTSRMMPRALAQTALQQGIDLLDLRNSSESLLWSLRRLW